MFACVRRHLVLEQEGEVAGIADAVEVAVDLVVLTPCEERWGVNDPTPSRLSLSALESVLSTSWSPAPDEAMKA